ncbi:MAG: homoserine O-acetyltransferase [Ignavibacteriales bacterium]
MNVKTEILKLSFENNPFKFESGEELKHLQIAYQTYGELNNDKSNVILICHALTGNAHAAGILMETESDDNSSPDLLGKYSKLYHGKSGWWDELIGIEKVFDTRKYFVICSNIIGSCYGTSGPTTIHSTKPFRMSFPQVTIRDMVRVQKGLIDYLGIKKILSVVGGSLGGMQAFEWALMYPDIVESIIPIATSVQHSPWAIALNKLSREAIMQDPNWMNGNYETQPVSGLSIARKLAMISYRSYDSFQQRFSRNKNHSKDKFLIETFLDHHAEKLLERFDANAYIYLSKAMDENDIAKNRGSLSEVLSSIKQKTMVIGISSDILYPPAEQKSFQALIPNSVYREINSIHGHDAFLIEFEQLTKFIGEFLSTNFG